MNGKIKSLLNINVCFLFFINVWLCLCSELVEEKSGEGECFLSNNAVDSIVFRPEFHEFGILSDLRESPIVGDHSLSQQQFSFQRMQHFADLHKCAQTKEPLFFDHHPSQSPNNILAALMAIHHQAVHHQFADVHRQVPDHFPRKSPQPSSSTLNASLLDNSVMQTRYPLLLEFEQTSSPQIILDFKVFCLLIFSLLLNLAWLAPRIATWLANKRNLTLECCTVHASAQEVVTVSSGTPKFGDQPSPEPPIVLLLTTPTPIPSPYASPTFSVSTPLTEVQALPISQPNPAAHQSRKQKKFSTQPDNSDPPTTPLTAPSAPTTPLTSPTLGSTSTCGSGFTRIDTITETQRSISSLSSSLSTTSWDADSSNSSSSSTEDPTGPSLFTSPSLSLPPSLRAPYPTQSPCPSNPSSVASSTNYARHASVGPNFLVCEGRYASEFIQERRLGRGGFGDVFQVKNRLTAQKYAIKKVVVNVSHRVSQTEARIADSVALREVTISAALNHNNIVRYFSAWLESSVSSTCHVEQSPLPSFNNSDTGGVYSGDSLTSSVVGAPSGSPATLYIQMELCTGETLSKQLSSSHREISATKALDVLRQALSALMYIHSSGYIHRDIKPSNIFFEKNRLKIGDFGCSCLIEKQQQLFSSPSSNMLSELSRASPPHIQTSKSSGVGTWVYAAPEQLTHRHYDQACDIYSLGVVLFEMLHPSFMTASERAHVFTRLRAGEFPESMERDFPRELNLIKKMMSKHPKSRPKVEELQSTVLMWLEDDAQSKYGGF